MPRFVVRVKVKPSSCANRKRLKHFLRRVGFSDFFIKQMLEFRSKVSMDQKDLNDLCDVLEAHRRQIRRRLHD